MIHIVTPFPSLLIYSFFVPTFLRLVLGLYVLSLTVSQVEKDPAQATEVAGLASKKNINFLMRTLLVLASLFILIGFFTQVAALVLIILFIISFFRPGWIFPREISRGELILLLVIAISLLFAGAGAFAIDYPL